MPSVAQAESLDASNPKLDIWLNDRSGVPVTPYVLQFQIFDVSTDLKQITPLQVYPAVSGDRTTVDLIAGLIAPGHYALAWDVDTDEIAGQHEVRWFFRATAGSPEQTWSEEFDVLSEAPVVISDFYVTVQDIRDLGVVNPPTNNQISAAIALSQQLIERATRQWFTPRALTFSFDGDGSDSAHFSVPIITLASLKINSSADALDTGLYKVYNANPYPDDRHNPRIKLVSYTEQGDIYTSSAFGALKFRKGRQNQAVSGTFGYVESDGSTPLLIVEAMKRLTIERLSSPAFGTALSGSVSIVSGPIVEEWTDGHRLRYSDATAVVRRAGISGITADTFVQDVIVQYRAARGIAVPTTWTFEA